LYGHNLISLKWFFTHSILVRKPASIAKPLAHLY
jgi:hypothetical protein